MKTMHLYLAAFVAGAVTLTLEIIGTRVLGPHFGVTIFLWTAMICIALVSLTVGYYLGAVCARRGCGFATLATCIGAAGVWIMAGGIWGGEVVERMRTLELQIGVILTGSLLFGPPLLFMGTTNPLLVALATKASTNVGWVSGCLGATGTSGAIAGAIFVVYLGVPLLGITNTLLCVGTLLCTLAVCLASSGMGAWPWLCGLGATLLISSSNAHPCGDTASEEWITLRCEESKYGELRVQQRGQVRILAIDGAIHTAMTLNGLREWLPYAVVLGGLAAQKKQGAGDRALVLGLGGGILASKLARDGWAVDAVEIDPEVVAIARKDFYLDPSVNVITDDARVFLGATSSRYHIIVSDVFGGGGVPFHLGTQEFYRLMDAALEPRGLVLANFVVSADAEFLEVAAETMATVWEQIRIYPATSLVPVGNVVVAAAHDPEMVQFGAGAPALAFALEKGYSWNFSGGDVFTDNRNAIDAIYGGISLRYAEYSRGAH